MIQAANARGEELAHLLATSTVQHRAQVTLEREVASRVTLSAVAGLETRVHTDSADEDVRSTLVGVGLSP